MKVQVVDVCGPVCVDPEDGERVYEDIADALTQGDPACVDFTGVTTLTSSFLNAAIGRLYGRFSRDDLATRVTYEGLDSTDRSLLRVVQENAIRYYAASPAQRERLLEAAAGPVDNR